MKFLKDHHLNIALIVFAVLVVTGVAWRIMTPRVDDPLPAPIGSVVGTYTDPAYHFSIDHDIRLKLASLEENTDLPWRYNTASVGTRVLTLRLPKEFQPHTNFGEGVVSVGVSADSEAIKTCLVPANGESLAPEADPRFTVLVSTDAGAGNFYEVTSYRTIQGGRCVALERMIHYTNIANYDKSQDVHEFDRAAVTDLLDRAVKSFRFN